MGSPHQITAESAWIYRIFTFGPARVSLTGETIHFEEHLGDALARMPAPMAWQIVKRKRL